MFNFLKEAIGCNRSQSLNANEANIFQIFPEWPYSVLDFLFCSVAMWCYLSRGRFQESDAGLKLIRCCCGNSTQFSVLKLLPAVFEFWEDGFWKRVFSALKDLFHKFKFCMKIFAYNYSAELEWTSFNLPWIFWVSVMQGAFADFNSNSVCFFSLKANDQKATSVWCRYPWA